MTQKCITCRLNARAMHCNRNFPFARLTHVLVRTLLRQPVQSVSITPTPTTREPCAPCGKVILGSRHYACACKAQRWQAQRNKFGERLCQQRRRGSPAAGIVCVQSMQRDVKPIDADMRRPWQVLNYKLADYRIRFQVHGLLPLPPYVRRVLQVLGARLLEFCGVWVCKYLKLPMKEPSPSKCICLGRSSLQVQREGGCLRQEGARCPLRLWAHREDQPASKPLAILRRARTRPTVRIFFKKSWRAGIRNLTESGNQVHLESWSEFLTPTIHPMRRMEFLEPIPPASELAQQSFSVVMSQKEDELLQRINTCSGTLWQINKNFGNSELLSVQAIAAAERSRPKRS